MNDLSSSDRLPRRVAAFVRTYVDHVVKLQFILMLNEAPNSTLSVAVVAQLLDIPKAQARDMAHELVVAGLARISSDLLELSPISINDRLAIADLAGWYAKEPGLILDALRRLGR
jgi:hypothetical protein